MLQVVVNLFWLAFAADGLLSLGKESFSFENHAVLTAIQGWLALVVLLLGIFMVLLLVATPRIPKRVVVPLLLFVLWFCLAGSFPLRRLGLPHLDFWLALLQVGLAGGIWLLFGEKGRKRLSFAMPDRPNFSWRHTLLVGPVLGLVLLVCGVLALVSGLATEIESRTGGYVRVHPDGVYLVERQFQRQGREVRLAGMMHVAREEFYTGILPKADPGKPAVVLVEGVTDRKRLLGQGSLKYANVARLLNISSQENSAFTEHVVAGLAREKATAAARTEKKPPPVEKAEIRFKHADVDVETFHPKTIAFIVAVMGLFQAKDFNSVVTALSDPASPLADAEVQNLAMQDILYSRNQRLVSEIESSMKDYPRIIVPWGALHLPDVETWLRSKDFVQSGEIERKAMAFW